MRQTIDDDLLENSWLSAPRQQGKASITASVNYQMSLEDSSDEKD